MNAGSSDVPAVHGQTKTVRMRTPGGGVRSSSFPLQGLALAVVQARSQNQQSLTMDAWHNFIR